MTPDQVAQNAAAVRSLADILTRWGLADAHDRATWIAQHLHREGWRHITPPPPLRGPSSTDAGRAAARAEFERIRDERRERAER